MVFIKHNEIENKKYVLLEFLCSKSHCLDLDLNGKRPGVASGGNFISYLIRRSGYG